MATVIKHIILNQNVRISIRISVKFIPIVCQIDNKSALVQVMAWRPTGDKLLPEPMLTHKGGIMGRWL